MKIKIKIIRRYYYFNYILHYLISTTYRIIIYLSKYEAQHSLSLTLGRGVCNCKESSQMRTMYDFRKSCNNEFFLPDCMAQ